MSDKEKLENRIESYALFLIGITVAIWGSLVSGILEKRFSDFGIIYEIVVALGFIALVMYLERLFSKRVGFTSKKEYTGTIIEESLEDNRVLNEVGIVDSRISRDENPQDRWHLYTVTVSKEEIEKLSRSIKKGTWYMHFWNKKRDIVAVFKGKTFEFNYDNKESWKDAVAYGISIGVPEKQLDFSITKQT
jgi:hypothetical protein